MSSHGTSVGETFTKRYLSAAVFVWLLLVIGVVPSIVSLRAKPLPADISIGVNPNAAPWWELAVLPQIGESTGRAIVEYRESLLGSESPPADGRAFHQPADLDRVKGIGPKTVQRIAKYLRFDAATPDQRAGSGLSPTAGENNSSR